jgi:hypothetical protein
MRKSTVVNTWCLVVLPKLMPLTKKDTQGDLSAIIIRNLPIWVELRRTPSRDIALMDNWEEKIEAIARPP